MEQNNYRILRLILKYAVIQFSRMELPHKIIDELLAETQQLQKAITQGEPQAVDLITQFAKQIERDTTRKNALAYFEQKTDEIKTLIRQREEELANGNNPKQK